MRSPPRGGNGCRAPEMPGGSSSEAQTLLVTSSAIAASCSPRARSAASPATPTSSVRRASNISWRVNPCSAASRPRGSLSSTIGPPRDEGARAMADDPEHAPLAATPASRRGWSGRSSPRPIPRTSSRSGARRCPGRHSPRRMRPRTDLAPPLRSRHDRPRLTSASRCRHRGARALGFDLMRVQRKNQPLLRSGCDVVANQTRQHISTRPPAPARSPRGLTRWQGLHLPRVEHVPVAVAAAHAQAGSRPPRQPRSRPEWQPLRDAEEPPARRHQTDGARCAVDSHPPLLYGDRSTVRQRPARTARP